MKLTRPIITLDLEGTGPDPAVDRILTLAITKDYPDGTAEKLYKEFNGRGIQMTEETIAVHGITQATADSWPEMTEVDAHVIHDFIKDCDILGFNAGGYDCPVLWQELYDEGITWNTDGIAIIDAGGIFKKWEPRTLTAAVKFYCGRDHEGAHGAAEDVQATKDVFAAQIVKYPDLAGLDVPALAKASNFGTERISFDGKIVRDRNGVPCYNIGDYRFNEKTGVGTQVLDNPGMAHWMIGKSFPVQTKLVLQKILRGEEYAEEHAEEGFENDVPF